MSDQPNRGFAVALPDTRGKNCYLTTGDGDPPRTYDPKKASRYATTTAAKTAITKARKRSPMRDRYMEIVEHPTTPPMPLGWTPDEADKQRNESTAMKATTFLRPKRITEEMVRLASGNGKHGRLPIDPWHIAANLNAMLELGYCQRCGLCPDGCEREGCKVTTKPT